MLKSPPHNFYEQWLPLDAPADSPLRVNVFVSPNAMTAETLVLLICGSGAVKAGMWARSLCINQVRQHVNEIEKTSMHG